MLQEKGRLFLICFLLWLFSFPSLAGAGSLNQGPISTVNPASIAPHGTSNQIFPDKPYHEYGTDGSPLRTPVPFAPAIDQCANGGCHYPTNRWFTDLIFTATTAANGSGDNFAVAESPYDVSVFDDVTTAKNANNLTYFNMVPGLYVRFNLPKLIVSSVEKPYQFKLNGDMYYPYLMSDPTSHLMFAMPNDINSFTPKTTRQILYYDPLALTTAWTLTNGPLAGGTMTAYLVRGAPYITMAYQQLPVILRTYQTSGFFAIAVDNEAPQHLGNNFGDKFTGSTFRIMLAVDDFSAGDRQKKPFPIRYFEYILFSSSPITLEFAAKQNAADPAWVLQTTTPFTGVVRLAYAGANTPGSISLPAVQEAGFLALQNHQFASAENMLEKYKDVYPTGVDLNLASDNHTGQVIFDWKTSSMSGSAISPLLMMAFEKNQKPYLSGVTDGDDQTYKLMTLRGLMVPVAGNEWTLSVPFSPELDENNLWYGSKRVPAQYQAELKEALRSDIAWLKKPDGYGRPNLAIGARNDSYAFGKQVARIARLALIADELGDSASRDIALGKVKEAISLWFPKTTPKDAIGFAQSYMRYDDKFGGTITARAASDPNNCQHDNVFLKNQCGYELDFYNGQYTDHHFHYGYFLYAAAVLAKFDSAWLSQYKESINLLARDLANPTSEKDPYFTRYRYFDWFEGHAFANGLGPGGDGRNQESTSEGINAWYGLTLWADVTGNKDLADTARIMTMLEARAAQDWTQIPSGDNLSIYDAFSAKAGSEFNEQPVDINMKDLIVSGINWSLKIDHTTFFGLIQSYLIGIQLMPYTPISNALIAPAWLASGGNILQESIDTLITKIGYYQLANNTQESVFGKFLTEWHDFAARHPDTPEKDYWIQVEGRLNGAYQWGLNEVPALAIINPDLAYQYLAFNTNGIFFNAMQKANAGFLAEALNKDGIVTLDGISTGRQCQPVDGNVKLYCYNYDNIQSDIGWPIAKLNYDGLDKGETVTNLLWWAFTHEPAAGSPEPAALFWLYDDPQAVNLTGSSATLVWEPATIINGTGALHYTVQLNGKNVCETDTNRCQLTQLQADQDYIAVITVTDKAGKILLPHSTTPASITTYANFRTLSSGMTQVIRFNGPITKQKTSDTSVTISWPQALLCDANNPDNCQPNDQIGYQVKSEDQSQVYCGTTPDSNTSCDIANLDPNTVYTIWVLAIDTTGKAQIQQLPYTFKINDQPVTPVIEWNQLIHITPNDQTSSAIVAWDAARGPHVLQYTVNVDGIQVYQDAQPASLNITDLAVGTHQVTIAVSDPTDPTVMPVMASQHFTLNQPIKPPSLTWTGASASTLVQGSTAIISWQPGAILKNGQAPLIYHAALTGTPGCTAADPSLNCAIDISGLKAGTYAVSLSASSGDLSAAGPSASLTIAPTPPAHPTITACRSLRPQVVHVHFSSVSSVTIQSMTIDGAPLNGRLVEGLNPPKLSYTINVQGMSSANYLYVYYSDNTQDKAVITPSQACQ